MSVSLYRKYRPARFEEIVGQDHVARTLVNAITHDRVSHAYLFTGPRGTGKTSTAKILAMALNCDAGQGKATATPDGTCSHCAAIRRGSALDVVEMDAASNRGIDDIRDLRDKVHFSPVEGRMKVYIVDEVHMLTPEAFNALLKTLEEPPAHAVFVLATTEPHKVPATILSRCQRFDFRRPSLAEVVSVLASIAEKEGIEVAETSLTVVARAAGGSFRDAIGILDQLATYSDGKISLEETLDILGVVRHDLLFEIVDLVHEYDTQGVLLFVERLSQGGTDYNQFMKDLLAHLRDVYVVKHTSETPSSIALSDEQLDTLRSQASRAATARIVTFIDLLGEALRAVRQGADTRLELELVLIKMTALARPASDQPEAAANAVVAVAPSPADPKAPSGTLSAAEPAPAATDPVPGAAAPAPHSPASAATTPEEPEEKPPSQPMDVPTSERKRREPSTEEQGTAAPTSTVTPDVDHLRRAWPLVLEAVKKRQAGLAAVLSEGRPESLEGGELVIKFPTGYGFQANQVTRGDNPRVISDALREVTGKTLRVSARVATDSTPQAAAENEDARILSRDELLRVLQQEFDAQVMDDGPAR